ncbi:hypothetical protein, partial [Chryseobacterium koreense]
KIDFTPDRISDLPAGRQVSALRVEGSNPSRVTENGMNSSICPFFYLFDWMAKLIFFIYSLQFVAYSLIRIRYSIFFTLFKVFFTKY